ncbi:unnamed protein product [Miscanthus lutarioriparius]|uniref:Uncharacterized protein n=1 Tax=Miscanthus lutarioriparius TaxID=422564 RepID=A0A811SF81_9POAL|nr:unnamed protein product [Miscanthus lutarioriparius]
MAGGGVVALCLGAALLVAGGWVQQSATSKLLAWWLGPRGGAGGGRRGWLPAPRQAARLPAPRGRRWCLDAVTRRDGRRESGGCREPATFDLISLKMTPSSARSKPLDFSANAKFGASVWTITWFMPR